MFSSQAKQTFMRRLNLRIYLQFKEHAYTTSGNTAASAHWDIESILEFYIYQIHTKQSRLRNFKKKCTF